MFIKSHITRCRQRGLLALALTLISPVVFAQHTPAVEEPTQPADLEPTTSSDIRRVLRPEEFGRFAPRTALDMVEQIPGFTIREREGGVRGLGQGDTNVLINGKRISGKSNGPVDALSRITATDVERLEIVDGASLGIGGLSGQVLNVITSTNGVTGQFRYSPQVRSRGTPPRIYAGDVSLSGGGAASDWNLRLRNRSDRFGADGLERVTDGAGQLIDTRDEVDNEDLDTIGLSGAFTRTAANGNVFNLTGEVNQFIFRGKEESLSMGPGLPDRFRTLRSTEDETNFEVGVDYAFPALGGSLKLIGYHRSEYSPTTSGTVLEFADGSPDAGSLFTRQADEFETIGRAELSFKGFGGDFQASLEGVRNTLDIESEFEVRDAQGVLQPVALPGATSRVDENRAEATLTYGRALTADLQFQASYGAEFSEISQSGESGLTRDFIRSKGFASLDWQASSVLNLSVKVERIVGQLNFFDFIASVNVNQEQVDATNPDLLPPQSWLFEAEATQSLGAYGSLTLRLFLEEVSDIVDQIPLEGGGQAPGNLSSARQFGGTLDATLLSEPLGWSGGRMDLVFNVFDTEITDPLLGIERRVSGTDLYELSLRLRQDFQGTDWAAGFDLDWFDPVEFVRLDQVSLFDPSFAFGSVYLEYKDLAGLTLRARIGNLFDQREDFIRTIFSDRLAGQIELVEDRSRRFGTIFTLDIEGSF